MIVSGLELLDSLVISPLVYRYAIPIATSQAQHIHYPVLVSFTMSSATNTHVNGRRPSAASRATAPSVMTMNGHFAAVGEAPTKEQYERGIQVIDEEQAFTYVKWPPFYLCHTDRELEKATS